MSQDQSKHPSFPQPPENETPPKKSNNTWIYLTLIGLLLATNVYMFMNRSSLIKERNDAQSYGVKADSSRAIIQQDYDAALARLDELVTENSQMDSLINDKNSEVAKMKREIDRIMRNSKSTKAELAHARDLIAKLNTTVTGFEEQIALLKTENATLTTQNQVISTERDSVVSSNVDLRQKGSVLVVSNIRMNPIDLRRSGKKEKETSKAKRVDIFRIVFDIVENRIAESGPKEMFVRIINPSGKLLSNAAYGSGVTTDAEGNSVNYTLSKQIQLQTNQRVDNVTLDWQQESNYEKGDYVLEIYNSGFQVGKGTIHLK